MSRRKTPWWWIWCGTLPELQPATRSKRFTFYGLQRNTCDRPRSVRHWNPGIHGIRDDWLLEHYRDVLEAAYDEMLRAGWPEPFERDHNGRIPVFLFAVDDPAVECRAPQMEELVFKGKYLPVLALPSRFRHTNEDSARHYAASCAVHELSHALGTGSLAYRRDITDKSKRPVGDWALFRSWVWFDEGRSVAAEARFLSGNEGWKPYGLEWVDWPERPLSVWEARYQAAFFVRYLDDFMEAKGHKNFTSLVWQKSRTVWGSVNNPNVKPLTALGALAEALHEHSQTFASPEKPDVFASNYCMESYFHCLPRDTADPRAFVTYKERAITRSWKLTRRHPKDPHHDSETTSIAPFACRYFRFTPNGNAGRLTVRVETEPCADLKVEMALVRKQTLERVPQSRARKEENGGKLLITSQSDQDLSEAAFDHAVLVVSHCPDLLSSKTVPRPTIEFTVSGSCA